MNPVDLLHRLDGHQSRILAHVDSAAALIALGPEAAPLPLAKNRWSAARMVREYQLFKHTEIFGPAILHGDAEQGATARRLRADCLAAGDHLAAYLARWSAQDVVAVWSEYLAATRAVSEQLRRHMVREQREVAMLLAGPAWSRRPAWLDAPTARAMPSPGRSPPAARADNRAR